MTYAESGTLLRTQLAELLRQHRVLQRLGGPGIHTVPETTTSEQRDAMGLLIRSYRQGVLVWCHQTCIAVDPYLLRATNRRAASPFRETAQQLGPLEALTRTLAVTIQASSAPLPTLESLTTAHPSPLIEHWRQAARAAALAEHDLDAGPNQGRLSIQQARAVLADVASITQALIVLDKRYDNIPNWEHLHKAADLGWAALACALDSAAAPADYGVDQRGWRPPVKPIRGPAQPGLLGVLQAQHNLTVALRTIPTSIALRLIVDAQRVISARLADLADVIEPDLADKWRARAATYTQLQIQLRDIGGPLGPGTAAAAEGANAVSRMKALRPETLPTPRLLASFDTLNQRIDHRIAQIIDEGATDGRLFERAPLPLLSPNSSGMVHRLEQHFTSLSPIKAQALLQATHALQRVPRSSPNATRSSEQSRADLHSALIHRPTPHATTTPPGSIAL